MNKENLRSMSTVNGRSDFCYLVSVAIKTTYNTRTPGGVERCVDVLNQLKSLPLSVKDIQSSESLHKLEILRNHRNLKIRKEARSLFHSWTKTLYTQGRDNSLKSGLKPKKPVLTRCSEFKNKEEHRSLLICEREGINKDTKTRFLDLKTREDVRPKTRETKTMKKETKTGFAESRKKEGQKSLSREDEEIKKKTYFMDLKKKEEHRSFLICEREETKKDTKTRFSCLKTREDVRPKTTKKETKIGFSESRNKEQQRSLSREGEEIKKKTYFMDLKKKEYEKTCEEKDLKKDTKTDLKPLSLKRRGDACEAAMTKKPRQGEVTVPGNQKMCSASVTATALTQHVRRNIEDKDGQITTKPLIPPPRRVNAWKNVPLRPVYV